MLAETQVGSCAGTQAEKQTGKQTEAIAGEPACVQAGWVNIRRDRVVSSRPSLMQFHD